MECEVPVSLWAIAPSESVPFSDSESNVVSYQGTTRQTRASAPPPFVDFDAGCEKSLLSTIIPNLYLHRLCKMSRSVCEAQGFDQKLAYAEGPEYILPVECYKDIYESVLVQHGDRPALVSVEQQDDSCFAGGPKTGIAQDCLRYTFRELHQHASALARILYVQGLRPQKILATFLPNSAEFAIALLAAAILNVSLVPLDLRSLTRLDEVQHQLGIIVPAALLVSDQQCAEIVDRLEGAEAYKSCLKILIFGTSDTTAG